MQHGDEDAARRRYEAIVLAALDFEPADDPYAEAARRRSARPFARAAGLVLTHVLFALLFAHAMSAGVGGTPLLVTGAGWATCTVLLVRMGWRAGARLLRPSA